MDHENLTYWKSPKKLNGRMARWHEKLQDYNFGILHIAGKTNIPAGTLLRPSGTDIPNNNRELALLPPELFIKVANADSDDSLESKIVRTQREQRSTLKDWEK